MEQGAILKLSAILGIIGFFALYQKFFNRQKNNFQEEINEILTDDKYKVKGQYERI